MKLPTWPKILGHKPIELGLNRMFEALEKLDNPHHNIPPVIHFAGTNGKGSTIAFTRSILEDAGYKCHVYTSPHLVEFNERIVLAGQEIDDDFLTEILDEVRTKTEGTHLTFFEGTTLAAILAFSRVDADFVLLETGLGGLLDATNIMGYRGSPYPILSVITPISLDHTEYLGDTIQQIAKEKAGIIKQEIPVILAPQTDEVTKIITQSAQKLNSPIYISGKDFDDTNLPEPKYLKGDHQTQNASVARQVAKALCHPERSEGSQEMEYKITPQNIKIGIESATWRARLQKLDATKFGFTKTDELYLDGGHNAAAAEAIVDFLTQTATTKKIHIITGLLKRKNAHDFINIITQATKNITFIDIQTTEEAYTFEELQKIYPAGQGCNNYTEALKAIQANTPAEQENLIIICGSLFLAGNVLEGMDENQV